MICSILHFKPEDSKKIADKYSVGARKGLVGWLLPPPPPQSPPTIEQDEDGSGGGIGGRGLGLGGVQGGASVRQKPLYDPYKDALGGLDIY